MKDLRSDINVVHALDSTNITASGATSGEVIDRQGYDSVTMALISEVITDGVYTIAIHEGSASGSLSAAPADDLIGVPSANTIGSADDNSQKTIGYNGGKRYVQLVVNATGITSGGNVLGKCILGHPTEAPATEG